MLLTSIQTLTNLFTDFVTNLTTWYKLLQTCYWHQYKPLQTCLLTLLQTLLTWYKLIQTSIQTTTNLFSDFVTNLTDLDLNTNHYKLVYWLCVWVESEWSLSGVWVDSIGTPLGFWWDSTWITGTSRTPLRLHWDSLGLWAVRSESNGKGGGV